MTPFRGKPEYNSTNWSDFVLRVRYASSVMVSTSESLRDSDYHMLPIPRKCPEIVIFRKWASEPFLALTVIFLQNQSFKRMDDESGLFTSDTLLGTPVDDLFSYQTVKVVRIQDRWLGLWDVCCQITIVLIISYMLIHEYGYLEWENVSGTVNTRILGGVQNVNMSLLEYCKEMPCRLVDRYSIASYDEKSLFIDNFCR